MGWVQLVLRLAAVCKSLHTALLGEHASELWSDDNFGNVHLSLTSKPGCCWDLWDRSTWVLATASQGLCRFLASRHISVCNAVVWGGSWKLPDLEQAIERLPGQLQHLQLMEIYDPDEAVWIADVLDRREAPVRITYSGWFPFKFPAGVEKLTIQQDWLAWWFLARELFSSLEPHWRLRYLELDLPRFSVATEHLQLLAVWHGRLERLVLRLQVTRNRQHAVADLTLLPSSVQVSLQLRVYRSGRHNFPVLLQQLLGVQLSELGVRSRSAWLTAAAEEHLAQCSIQTRLTLDLTDAPARRLQCLPAGPAVVYGRLVRGQIA